MMGHLGTVMLTIVLAVTPVRSSQNKLSVLNISPDAKVSTGNFRLNDDGELLGYVMKVKNTGSKIITAFVWIYEAEVRNRGREKFVKVNEGTIKTRILSEEEKRFDIPPTPDEPVTHRLVVTRVEFEDDTVWEPPQSKENQIFRGH